MSLFFMHVTLIIASLYLLPLEWYTLLKRIQANLDRRQQQQIQAAIRQAWLDWVVIVHQRLKHKDVTYLQRQTLRQALACGKRYLHTTVPSAELRVYYLTEQICQEIQQRLQNVKRSKKMGPGRCDPAPSL